MRLQTRYSILLTAMILSLLIFMGGLLLVQISGTLKTGLNSSAEIMQENLYNQLERDELSVVNVLAINLVNPVYRFDTNEMYLQLQSILSLPEVEYAIIYDSEGGILHDGEEEISRFGTVLTDEFSVNAVNSRSVLVQMSDSVMEVSHPLFIGEKYLGGVRVGMSLNGVNNSIASMSHELGHVFNTGIRDNLLFVGGVSAFIVLGIGMLLATLVSRSISLPVQRLANYARNIGRERGTHQNTLPEDRQDELGDLTRSIKAMVARLKESSEKANYQAKHDQLTDLPNRTLFIEFLNFALGRAKRERQQMAVMFIDLDDFKKINDTLGHAAGDELLKQFSRRLKSSLRSCDFISSGSGVDDYAGIARLGGDEFTVLLDNIDNPTAAMTIAERILMKTRRSFTLSSGRKVFVGASIGITVFPDDGTECEQLLRNADIAMYSAKSKGKNNYAFFTDEMNAAVKKRVELESELRTAIEQQQLQLFYQPLLDAISQKIIGVEALVRWKHPDRGFISPAEFIPVAEQTGLIHELGDWVIRTACRQLVYWQKRWQVQLYCAVNVSGVQLRDSKFPERTRSVLEQTQLPAHFLHAELTETALLTNEEEAKHVLEELRRTGIDIWMDDFGTGYSSLSFLKKFSVQGVKVDRSFVHDMETNDESRGIVNAVIAMAKSLNIRITAEGIENNQQANILKSQQCDVLQGYLLGKPMPANQLESLIKKSPERFNVYAAETAVFRAS